MLSAILITAALGAKIFTVPSSSSLNMASYPPLDTLVTANPQFTAKYDLSAVPRIPLNSPAAALGPPTCNATGNYSSTGSCLWSCGLCVRPEDRIQCTAPGRWALTFDDGPAPSTDKILDYLASKGLLGSFYVVGSRVKENPAILKRIYEEGHQIGIHSYSHRAFTTLSNEVVIAELEWTIQAIEHITGVRPKYVRPPFGDHDDRIRGIFKAMGLVNSMWDFDTEDWRLFRTPDAFPGTSLEDNVRNKALASESLPAGVISIQHDLYEAAMARAPSVIDALLTTKMFPMPLSECIDDPAPYANPRIVLPKSGTVEKVPIPNGGKGTVTPPSSGTAIQISIMSIVLAGFSYYLLS